MMNDRLWSAALKIASNMSRKYRVRGKKIPKILYHLAPKSRRRSICKNGLRIGRRSNHISQFRPDYLCFSDTPARVITMCPHIDDGMEMDLYQVWTEKYYKVYRVPQRRGFTPEWRIMNDIPKVRFTLIATRKMCELVF